ncbi:hypothetical protein [Flavobacterium sp. HJJ]|uniref:hypothetical protein n=1 Tax=Flavobacterium sp. HJJ TaxID=2783792 RepID=UPI00188CF149|nr:hypothetical protein [Flavobacterium sp. HJJ]MBF4473222.1 hypothetical protein [Flavobacterium sp. HJJ]
MKKVFKIIGIYLLIIVLSESCSPQHYLISDIEFYGASIDVRNKEREYNTFTETNILKNEIIFIIGYKTKFIANLDLGLSAKCYAFKRGRINDNSLLENTYSLKFNHPFKYKNVTISANQNLLEIEEIKNQIEIYDIFYDEKILEFSPKLKSESVFTPENYEVTFSCRTSDNKLFEKKITVKIEN